MLNNTFKGESLRKNITAQRCGGSCSSQRLTESFVFKGECHG